MANDFAYALFVGDGCILPGLRSARRRLYPNRWDVLGGRVETREALDQALQRKLDEQKLYRIVAARLVSA